MDAQTVVDSLDGAPLRRVGDGWSGFFEGTVRVENASTSDEMTRFDLLIPTSRLDISDFIWDSERKLGTTDKVVLSQRRVPISGAKVIAIDREGADARWTNAPEERYRITFEVPLAALQVGVPLDLALRWPDGGGEPIATAEGWPVPEEQIVEGEAPAVQSGEEPSSDAFETTGSGFEDGDYASGIVASLDEAAQLGVARAEALRIAGADRIHMEHLLAGLYAEDPGPARAAIGAHMSDAEFRQVLAEASKFTVPEIDLPSVGFMRAPPRFSSHALAALTEAARIASAADARRIGSGHLFAGAMAVLDCAPIGLLSARGVSGDDALNWKPTTSDAASVRRTEPTAQSDHPTDVDLLGYRGLVDALARLLNGQNTTFPLTIAISAPWGGGKSSVIRQLTSRLQRSPGTRWTTIQFPAWKYETGEQLWAALATEIYRQALAQRSGTWDRTRFRWRLERARRSIRAEFIRVLVVVSGTLIGALGGYALATIAGQENTAPATAIGGIGGLIGFGRAASGDLADPFKRAVESFTTRLAGSGDGFTPDAATQVKSLMDVLLRDQASVAIFIDDLDRCSPRNLVRMIEATSQIFITGSDWATASDPLPSGSSGSDPKAKPRLVFVMGMDRQVVARGIETEYKSLLERLKQVGDPAADDYGMSFLDKIIQLWVSLPAPKDPALETLLRSVAGVKAEGEQTGGSRTPETPGPAPATSGADGRSGRTQPAGPRRALDGEAVEPMPEDDPRIWPAMVAGAHCLEANPRQIKRFNNAFRLQLHLVAEAGQTLTDPQLAALSKWIAIRLRWGLLAHDMDAEPELLWALDQVANGRAPTGVDRDRLVRQRQRTPRWFDARKFEDRDELMEALRTDPGEVAVAELPFETFLRVA